MSNRAAGILIPRPLTNIRSSVQLHFKTFGRGRPVVLLHGLFGSSDNWYHITLQLAKLFQVFAVDLRNHGQSPHSDEMNYPLMAADVARFMAAQGIPSSGVIGHSMGGKTAMQLALQFPDRVDQLIVSDMAPRAYPPVYADLIAAQLALDLKSYSTRQEIEDALAPQIPGLALRRFLLKNLGRDSAGAFFWKLNLRGLADNYWQLGQPVSGSGPFLKPALFIRGGQSNYINASDEPLIRDWFPAAAIKTIPAAGHWVHADQPEEFLRLVLDFL